MNKPDINGRIYPTSAICNWMRDWMDKLKNEKVQIGELSHPDRNKEFVEELQKYKWEVEFPPVFNKDNAKLDFNPRGLLFYMDYVYDDGEMHLKTNRKRVILEFNWMEEQTYGTRYIR